MRHAILALASVLVVAAVAVADVLKPAIFQKTVTVEHTITTDKDHPDYVFFLIPDGGKPIAVKFGPKQPIVFKGTTNAKDRGLVAVPTASRKGYATEEDFERAVGDSKVDGMVRANETLFAWIFTPLKDKRNTIIREYKLAKIDPKAGVVLEMTEVDPNGTGGGCGDSTHESSLSVRTWIAGLAASLGIALGGLRVAGRVRRKD